MIYWIYVTRFPGEWKRLCAENPSDGILFCGMKYLTSIRYKRYEEVFEMEENEKIVLFEKASIPSAVAKLSVPMIFSSLVMVL